MRVRDLNQVWINQSPDCAWWNTCSNLSDLKRDLFIFLSTDWLPFLHNNPTSTWAAEEFQEVLLFLIFPLAVTSKPLMVFNLQPAVRSWSSSPWLWSIPHTDKLKHLLQQNGLVSLVLLLSQAFSLTFPLQDYLSFFSPLCAHLTLVWVYPNHFTMNGAFVHCQCFSPRNNPAEITRITLGKKQGISQEKWGLFVLLLRGNIR